MPFYGFSAGAEPEWIEAKTEIEINSGSSETWDVEDGGLNYRIESTHRAVRMPWGAPNRGGNPNGDEFAPRPAVSNNW